MLILGKTVVLRQIQRGDLTTLWEWRNDQRFTNFCSVRRSCVSLEEFNEEMCDDFSHDRHEQYLIYKNTDDNKPIGTTYSYNYNQTDGHVFITTYLEKGHDGRGYGVAAAALFSQYLFEFYALYKIYSDVYKYNERSLKPLLKFGATEEGCFKNHRLHRGRRWDLIRLAVYSTQLGQLRRLTQIDKVTMLS